MTSSAITVIGAGSWGTALAVLLARNGNQVRLWGKQPEMVEMQAQRENRVFLPGVSFPDKLTVVLDLADSLADVQDVLLVIPSSVFRLVVENIKPYLAANARIVWATKGIDPGTLQLLDQVVMEILGEQTSMAVLSGPSFAKEVGAGLPSAVSLASNDVDFATDLTARFHGKNFRVYQNPDMAGVQLCGALKNVLAIAVGMADGLGFGANARAALITRGLAEMGRLCEAMGGHQKTLMSLACMGDLVLTCTDNQSRNRRFGLALGQGKTAELAKQEIGQAVEGFDNAKQAFELSKQHAIQMPIVEQVYNILYQQRDPKEAVMALLDREPTAEL